MLIRTLSLWLPNETKKAIKVEALFEKDHGNVSDLLFEDIRIVKSNRGIGVWQRDGNGTMSDITFNNIEIETNYMIMPQFWGSAGSYHVD